MQDSLGDRMKENYEDRTRILLPRRTYTIIRVDGKAFHSYTKNLKTPFDQEFMDDMDNTACYMCKNISGAQFGFVQSDEISILVTDFSDIKTQAWFDNNLQKMCSVSASMATAMFNKLRSMRTPAMTKIAEFDSRVFTIPQKTEVENYFIWRQNDTTRNSISSTALHFYSHKQLHGKSTNEKQEMIFQSGVNWDAYPAKFKRGRMIIKEDYEKDEVKRSRWVSVSVPIFTQDRKFLSERIQQN